MSSKRFESSLFERNDENALNAIETPFNSLGLREDIDSLLSSFSDQQKTRRFGRHFEAICTNSKNGKVYISSSNVEGSESQAMVHMFENIEDVPERSILGVCFNESSCKEMIFTASEHLIAGFDSGTFLICDESMSRYKLCRAHKGYFTALIVDRVDGGRLVTASNDCSLKVWDLESLNVSRVFPYAHALPITGVDFAMNSNDKLISCGKDKLILNWDLRQSKPASKYALISENYLPTSLNWSSRDANIFYVGVNNGVLFSFDARKLAIDLGSRKVGNKSVVKIKCLPETKLGFCLHSNEFGVLEEISLKPIYYTKCGEHSFVRDFIEYENTIYTVGFHSNLLLKHTIVQ